MKQLTRSAKPRCLNQYRAGTHNWDDVTASDKVAIWKQFDLMQMGFCAYCECTLSSKHIEHFKTRDSTPGSIFEWSNLFGSCDDRGRCGHYKDSQKAKPYDISNIIKPDLDDVNKFLLFLTNGRVSVRNDLSPRMELKARETIRVLNLNGDTTLVNRRKTSFKQIKPNIDSLYQLIEELDYEDWIVLLEDEIHDVINDKVEFETAMTNAWRFNQEYE
jgi:uncharacterized protein (TIGR02646 family)